MKKGLLHILPFLFSIVLFSCTAIETEDAIDHPANETGEVSVSFQMDMPSSRNADELDDNYYWERYIAQEDVHVYVFSGDKYLEKMIILSWEDEMDGNETRSILGRLRSAHEGQEIELVVLTNMKRRGTPEPVLKVGKTTKEELYKQLVFQYGDQAWTFSGGEKNYIPMWGISTPFSIEADKMNEAGAIKMYRAIAKIDIHVKGGAGIDNFIINKVELVNVPDRGYCASLETPNADNNLQFERASYPDNIAGSGSFTVYSSSEGETAKTKVIENKIYVPEMGQYKPYPYFYINLEATVGINKTPRNYKIYMRENQGDYRSAFEIIRNHKYIININSITNDEEIKIIYNVDTWGEGTDVNIPFN